MGTSWKPHETVIETVINPVKRPCKHQIQYKPSLGPWNMAVFYTPKVLLRTSRNGHMCMSHGYQGGSIPCIGRVRDEGMVPGWVYRVGYQGG